MAKRDLETENEIDLALLAQRLDWQLVALQSFSGSKDEEEVIRALLHEYAERLEQVNEEDLSPQETRESIRAIDKLSRKLARVLKAYAPPKKTSPDSDVSPKEKPRKNKKQKREPSHPRINGLSHKSYHQKLQPEEAEAGNQKRPGKVRIGKAKRSGMQVTFAPYLASFGKWVKRINQRAKHVTGR